MKHRVMTIYGKRCVAIYTPKALAPRLFAKASDEPKKKRSMSCPMPIVATMHSLRLFDKDGNNLCCPFVEGRIRSESCLTCPHNLRKRYCSILPPYSIECELYDARKMSVNGDYRGTTHMPVLDITMSDVEEMAEYASRIPRDPKFLHYNGLPQAEKVVITNELIILANGDEE